MHNVLWIDSITNFFTNYWNSFDWESILSNVFTKLLSLILLFLLFYFGKKFLHFLFKKTILSSVKVVRQSENRQKTIVKLLENMLDYFLYFILIYWILSIIGVPISSLLAGAGIAGVALGLGAQGFLSDVINGLFILLERQFEVGDAVLINNISGTIASVGVRTTQVRGYDGTLHYIPNRNITVVSNQSRGNMRALIELPLNSNVDLKSVYSVIEEINNQYTRTRRSSNRSTKNRWTTNQAKWSICIHHRSNDKKRFATCNLPTLFNTLSRSTAKTRHRPLITSHPIFNQLKKKAHAFFFCFLIILFTFLCDTGMVYQLTAL